MVDAVGGMSLVFHELVVELATFAEKVFDGLSGFFRNGAGQLLMVVSFAGTGEVFDEKIDAVLCAGLARNGAVHCADVPDRNAGVTAHDGQLFDHKNAFDAEVLTPHSGGHAGGSAADDDYVEGFIPTGLFLRCSFRQSRSAECGCAESGNRLEKMSALWHEGLLGWKRGRCSVGCEGEKTKSQPGGCDGER